MRYRRSVYRKRKIRIIVITTLCVLCVLAIALVIVGNVLGNKVAQRTQEREPSANTSTNEHVVVKDVNAYPVALEAAGSTLNNRVASAVRNGYTDICFDVTDDSGALLYASATAQALGKQSSATDLRSPEAIVKIFADNKVYSCAVLDASELENKDELLRSASIGYYAAISAELLRAGVDEVLISVGEIPVTQYGELITLASEIHRLSQGKGYVGISLPSTVFSNEKNDELVGNLWSSFDYLAVDLCSKVDYEGDVASQIGAELGTMLYDLLRHNVRVLLPNVSDAQLATEIKQTVSSEGAKSFQIMP